MARTLSQQGPERANRLIFIGAIMLAVLAAVLVFVALSNFGGDSNTKDNASVASATNVVTASRDLSAGTKITADMLSTASLPAAGVISGAITDKSSAVGATVRVNVAKGEQFSDVKLGQSAKSKLFSDVVPQGKRAAAVKVDETSFVGGLPLAGDHVDVIVIGKKDRVDPTKPEKEFPTAFTLLQDVEVLSVSDTALKPAAPLSKDGTPIVAEDAVGTTGTRNDKTDAAPSATSVTLAVEPSQVPLVALASEEYKVYLALRPNGDKGTVTDPSSLITLPAAQ